jgi:chromosome segregation ATPase
MAILSGVGTLSNLLLPSEIGQPKGLDDQSSGDIATTETSPPPYQFNLPRLTLGALGIDVPKNFGDSSAIFAEIALLLEKTIDEARKNRTQAETALLRSAYSTVIELTQTLVTLDQSVKELKAERSEKQNQLEDKQELKESLQAQQAAMASEVQHNNDQLLLLRIQLFFTIDPAARAVLESAIAWLENRNASLNGSIQVLQNQINSADEAIGVLSTEIADLTTAIKDGEDLYNKINETSLGVALSVVSELQGSKLSQSLADSGADFHISESTEKVLRDLVELDARNQDLAAIRQRLEDQDIDRMTADRILAATVSLITALKEVLGTLQSLDGSASPDTTQLLGNASSRVHIGV